jgi:integrase/recombinase XerD
MKKLPLQSESFRYVERSFKDWLDVLGYAQETTRSMPVYVRGFLFYLEQQGKTKLTDINSNLIKSYYYEHLKSRPNQLYGGGLSNRHLNKHIQALHRFTDYLRQSGRLILPVVYIPLEENDTGSPAVLTESEIKLLYDACDCYPCSKSGGKPDWFYPVMALRDKAMLAVYYGCGLRRNEGTHIGLSDFYLEKQILHVRKGKNYKERFVPISKSGIKQIENYLYDGRPFLLKQYKQEAFFINERGRAMQNMMMNVRLATLIRRTENEVLIQKKATLHTLRHSIATHLLGNGMALEKIKDFLGHSSLESTQIYTHLLDREESNP